MSIRIGSLVLILATVLTLWAAAEEQKFAELGDFALVNGEVIRDCRIGYRTFGELNADKSNAVLFPTWFGGTSADLAWLIGPGRLVDTGKYFAIAVDALGNGVSSSPSNSLLQPGEKFPGVSIRDMVRSQHRLVTEVLGLGHLHAVVGGSMGGMQAFEWSVGYPQFVDRVVSYVGTPRTTSYDLLLCHTLLQTIESGKKSGCPEKEIVKNLEMIMALVTYTPEYRVQTTSRADFPEYLRSFDQLAGGTFTSDNWAVQLQAMIGHDISAPFEGSLQKTAAQVRARLLVIVSLRDHLVNPQPALEFAGYAGAQTLSIDSALGHLVIGYELDKVGQVLHRFLDGE